ncbi:CLUMA_CG011584, isoform A [Clunio marinus]|uniref:CLUMA_CG011584, isoform A n=1 Tax=Clunio marinus TaxID=568069 RepID=A0A1J1ID70_9DIPT|nr:CLUMA_CG011584, isoform A [Clunio marinus]
MESEIDNLLGELRVDKISIRQKAFNKLFDILTSRFDDLQKIFERSNDLGWKELFEAAHSGIKIHSPKISKAETNLHPNDPKITVYSRVLLKLCDNPANESFGIPYQASITAVLEILRDESYFRYFGVCYLQVLQKSIFKVKNNLTSISLDSWQELLKILTSFMNWKENPLPFTELTFCTNQVIEYGCNFSHLTIDLENHLEMLARLLEERKDPKEKLELLLIAYNCCQHISAESRFTICRFTEEIAKHIHIVFKVDMNEEVKVTLFKLVDLSLIVHYPNLGSCKEKLQFIANESAWKVTLRNFIFMVELELKNQPKTKYRGCAAPELNQIVAQFAARLCYIVYWNNSIWDEIDYEEQLSKRQKRSEKLQALIDFAQPTEELKDFNWKWLTVLSELLYNYPSALENDHFQLLLQLLSRVQESIEHESHIYAFTKCCHVLLQREENFVSTANIHVVNLCHKLWFKIVEATVRVCTSNNKNSVESHILLQTLIHHKKFPSQSFIEDVVKIFITKSSIKSDATLKTLIVLMKSFNIDSLQNGRELTSTILSYTFEKASVADLRRVITTSGKEKPTNEILSQIGVICCLSKTDVVNYSQNDILDNEKLFQENWKLDLQVEYKKEINEKIQLILMKCSEKLLIEEEDFIEFQNESNEERNLNEFPKEIKCIIDHSLYEELQNVTEFKNKLIGKDDNIEVVKDYLQSVLENNEMLLHLADNFLKFEAFNEEKFKSSFLTKKIEFHLQEVENLFEMIVTMNEGLEMKDTHELLKALKRLFSSKFHIKLCFKIRSFDLEHCIHWIGKQIKHKFLTYDDDYEQMKIGRNEFINAKMEERLKFLAVETLCEYNNFDGMNSEIVHERLSRVKINVDDNMDLHIESLS